VRLDLQIEQSAADFGSASDDHRVPERDPDALMDADRGKDVVIGRNVQVGVGTAGYAGAVCWTGTGLTLRMLPGPVGDSGRSAAWPNWGD